WQFAVVGFAATLALIALFVSAHSAPPLSFQVDAHTGHTNDQISSRDASVHLSFSDGTLLTLGATSRAHVVSLEQHGAQVALESGSLSANVVHTGMSVWSLSAGPFSVRVTGTKFLLSWDPDHQRFSIQVAQGSVAVSGSVVGAERPVRAGETLVVSVPDRWLELSNVDRATAEPAPTASSTTPAPPIAASATDAQAALAPAEPSARSPSPSSWRALATQGKMREAYASADAAGFDQACDSANAADLLLLGDAARLAGRPDRVSQALLQLRRRFPRDPRSAAAAFILGKVRFDQGGADRAAANWFATSLREQPKGSLAREAAGRLIEALHRAGDSAGAARAAKDYLTWYPDGPHAALARSLLP
ncbi:MAG TPA: FecR domain-containing protein, partial [Polyangiaceae bacterium]